MWVFLPGVGGAPDDWRPPASLHVVKGGGYDLAITHATEIAPLISAHLY